MSQTNPADEEEEKRFRFVRIMDLRFSFIINRTDLTQEYTYAYAHGLDCVLHTHLASILRNAHVEVRGSGDGLHLCVRRKKFYFSRR